MEDIVIRRQENAKNAYAEWLEKKRHEAAMAVANRSETVVVAEHEVKSFVKDLPPHVAWMRKKNRIEQSKKKRESSNQNADEIDKRIQKQLSIDMYKSWLAQSKLRNKPVPFGQGLLSMRQSLHPICIRICIHFNARPFSFAGLQGCIAFTYTNTNEWISQ